MFKVQIVILCICLTFALCKIDNGLHTLEEEYLAVVAPDSGLPQTDPTCRPGYHWIQINPDTNLGMCVKDWEENCQKYDYRLGLCKLCSTGFTSTLTKYHDHYCLKDGTQMPDLKVLKNGNPASNLKDASPNKWLYWLIIVVLLVASCVILGRCWYRKKYKQLDSNYKAVTNNVVIVSNKQNDTWKDGVNDKTVDNNDIVETKYTHATGGNQVEDDQE